jgi:hypothetical protein
MTLQKTIILLLVLATGIARFDNNNINNNNHEVSAWISIEPFRPSLLSTSIKHNNNKNNIISTINHSSPVLSRTDSKKSISSSQLKSKSNRRSFLEETSLILLPIVALTVAPFPSHAKYGDASSLALPSYIDYLIEKNAAAANDSTALYQGADPSTVLKRLSVSERRLGEVYTLAEEKKWSQITGLVTGPLGTLSMTMNQIVSIVSSSNSPKKTKQVQDAVRKVKEDILGIGQAAARKNAIYCTKQTDMASTDLKALLQIAFD